MGKAGWPGLVKVDGQCGHVDKQGSGGSFGRVCPAMPREGASNKKKKGLSTWQIASGGDTASQPSQHSNHVSYPGRSRESLSPLGKTMSSYYVVTDLIGGASNATSRLKEVYSEGS